MAGRIKVCRATGDFCELVAGNGQTLYFWYIPEIGATLECDREPAPKGSGPLRRGTTEYGAVLHAAHIAMWDARLDASLRPRTSLRALLMSARAAYGRKRQEEPGVAFKEYVKGHVGKYCPRQALETYLAVMRLNARMTEEEHRRQGELAF